MNWITNLNELLLNSERRIDISEYLNIKKDIIKPVIIEIDSILNKYNYETTVKGNYDEIIVKFGSVDWFAMKCSFHAGRLKIEYFYADTTIPTIEPLLILKSEKQFELYLITNDLIGEAFIDGFEEVFELIRKGRIS